MELAAVMPERRRRLLTPPWLLAISQRLRDKQNTPDKSLEKNLQKQSSTGLEGETDKSVHRAVMKRKLPDDLLDVLRYPEYYKGCLDYVMEGPELAFQQRKNRQSAARQFRSDYIYGITTFVDGCNKRAGHAKERKTCIWSGGRKSSSLCKSSGIMWVGVHGMDSVCVVTKDEKLDKTRVDGVSRGTCNLEVLNKFRVTLLSEIEDLVDSSSGLHELFALDVTMSKPLGVVSVTEGFDKFHAECNHETPSSSVFDEEKAVEFLQEKMQSGLAFTYNETMQTAISAFQRLFFHQNFNAKDIRVFALNLDDDCAHEVRRCDIHKCIAAE